MLSNQKLALLNSKLYVPIVVRDILENKETTQDDVRYALHEVISEFQPDAALLCIALSAKYIANMKGQNEVSFNVMALECDRIIEDYGYLWLQHAEQTIDNEVLFDTLVHVPEDLESLSELISINAEFLRNSDETATELLDILKIQADAQAIIAEHYIEAVDAHDSQEPATTEQAVPPAQTMTTNNVIQFPGGMAFG